MDTTVIAAVFIIYLVFIMIIGTVAAKFGRTIEGYFLADRKIGSWVTAISSVASSESGWVVMGLVGEGYMWGFAAVWAVVGCLLGYLCNWYLLAPRLRRVSKRLKAITIPEYLEERFGDRTHLLRILGVTIIILCLMGYVSAQFTATAKAFREAFGMTYFYGVILGGAITIIYTLVGGFRAVSWTDLAQGLLMVFGLVVLPIFAIMRLGGIGPTLEGMQNQKPRVVAVMNVKSGAPWHQFGVEDKPVTIGKSELSTHQIKNDTLSPHHCTITRKVTSEGMKFFVEDAGSESGTFVNGQKIVVPTEISPGDTVTLGEVELGVAKIYNMYEGKKLVDLTGGATGAAAVGWIIGLLGISLGYPGQPHVLTRYMAAKDEKKIRQARLIAIIWGILVLYGAVILGHAARVMIPGILDPEQSYPAVAMLLFNPLMAGLILAAIVSAMMSTADSQLLVIASAVARDIYNKIFRTQASQKDLMIVSRLTVLLVGIAALLIALTEVRVVFWFVLFTWSALGASFGPPILLSLFWKRTTKWGAAVGLIAGFLTTIVWKLKLKAMVNELLGISLYELVPAFIFSLIAVILVSLFTRPPEEAVSM